MCHCRDGNFTNLQGKDILAELYKKDTTVLTVRLKTIFHPRSAQYIFGKKSCFVLNCLEESCYIFATNSIPYKFCLHS